MQICNMETKSVIFSIIIPHRNSIHFLPKLFSSIPQSDDIEIILVDNSPTPCTKEEIGIERDYLLLYSEPARGAGGARNVGIENAQGKWLIFADADDYFSDGAFDTFYSKMNSDADIVYTCMSGIYIDTGEYSKRGDSYTNLVRGYLNGTKPEMELRLRFASPCSKMVRSEFVIRYNIRYDEVPAGNDMYFSMLSGYYAERVEAIDAITYIATVSKGSLTKQRNLSVIESRYRVFLRYNKFLKEHNLSTYQYSIMYFLKMSIKFGLSHFIRFIGLLIKYRQNPFVNCTNWLNTFRKVRSLDKQESRYITK